jgi:hypothetical protein
MINSWWIASLCFTLVVCFLDPTKVKPQPMHQRKAAIGNTISDAALFRFGINRMQPGGLIRIHNTDRYTKQICQ